MDWKLVLRARATGKPIVYLETLEHQLAGIAKWMDVRALRTMLDDMSLVRAIGQQMLVAFVSGDESQILAVTEREHAAWLAGGRTQVEYDEQMADVLYRRNASWMPAIEKIVTEGGGFIAVGAAHTVGPRSVVELLVQRGYTVTRITR